MGSSPKGNGESAGPVLTILCSLIPPTFNCSPNAKLKGRPLGKFNLICYCVPVGHNICKLLATLNT